MCRVCVRGGGREKEVTFVVSLISVLNAKIIALDVQLHIWQDELLLDKLPDHPKQRGRERGGKSMVM